MSLFNEYKSRGFYTKKEAKAILSKFLMANNLLQTYVRCYNYDRARTKYYRSLTTKDAIDATINYLWSNNFYLGDAFIKIKASFGWQMCDEVCDDEIWRKLNKTWVATINPRAMILDL